MIQLDFGDRRPLYEQVKEKIKKLIISGALAEDGQIPSVREIAALLAINPNTIQRAYKDLESEGYIYSVRAKGSFVAPLKNISEVGADKNLLKQIKKLAKEANYFNVPKGEVLKIIDEVYKEDNND